MQLPTELASCVLRPWETKDKASLVRLAGSRAVWRNLLDSFPHPYAEADADHWLSLNHGASPPLHSPYSLMALLPETSQSSL